MSAKRALDQKEVERLIVSDDVKKRSERTVEWPGEDNMRLLAEAVQERRQHIEFNGVGFSIRYSDQRKDIFISPSEPGMFVPCGYFEYDRLRAVIA